MNTTFYKYQGTGNDFILFDNRDAFIKLSQRQVQFLCDRHRGIGADGLMLLNQKDGYDFEMVYYNSDGLPGSMCGNGGRCIVKFAWDIGMKQSGYTFLASDGNHEAKIDLDKQVSLKMKDVEEIELGPDYFLVDTGSPHYVRFVNDINDIDVAKAGAKIRYSKPHAEKGVNVNFVERIGKDSIFVRTYERGVETETMSCGTGVTASALVAAHNENGFNSVEVKTLGGNLSVEFEKLQEQFTHIWLEGAATFVFKGEIELTQ